MKEKRPQRIQVWISDRDLATLTDEADRQHRRATNLAAAIIAKECEQIRKREEAGK
jgi:hypothetical protein